MKLTKIILGCLLAAGLTAHAADSSQNGTVINNIVYTPLNFNLQGQYTDSKGNVHEASIKSKDLLNLLGFSSKDQFATDYDGFGDSADVFVIDKDSVLEDLTLDDICNIDFNELVNKLDKNGKNGSFQDVEKGILSVSFDSTNIQFATVANEAPISQFSFEGTGVYVWQASGGGVKNNGDQKNSTKLTASSIIGEGFDSSLAPTIKANVPSNTGDFLIKGGTINGNGDGTVNNE